MWELDCEERWAPKYWCFWTESSLDCEEMQPVHSKGDQSWVFFGRTDAKAETPILWPLHAKSWLIGKDADARRDWGQEGKGMTEDGMAGWHHQLKRHEFEWTLGVGDGQGGLACCNSWDLKESDTTERLKWTEESGLKIRDSLFSVAWFWLTEDDSSACTISVGIFSTLTVRKQAEQICPAPSIWFVKASALKVTGVSERMPLSWQKRKLIHENIYDPC